MKNILVIGSELTDFLKAIERMQKEKAADVTVIPCTYDEFSFDISTENQKIFFRHKPLHVHGIYFRSFSKHFFIASTLALYCERNAIRFNNTSTTSRISNGKLFQGLAFLYANLPTPRTLFFHRRQILTTETKKYVEENLSYPVIVKSIAGAEGRDNYLAHSWSDVEKIMTVSSPDIQYIFQECIPNDSDHRLLTLNHTVKVAYKRVRDDKTSHLNNVSQGAHTEAVELSAIPHLIPLAEAASNVMQKEVCGVDIMINSDTGKPYIIEANPSPGLSAPGTIEAVFTYLQDLPNLIVPPVKTAQPNSAYNGAKSIEKYFLINRHFLSEYDYFHFLSRLQVWTGNSKYRDLIVNAGLASHYLDSKKFATYLHDILNKNHIPENISDPIQETFYKKYPTVPYVARILSKTRHAYTLFDKDYKSEVYKIYSDEELAKLCEDILNDPSALYVFTSHSDTTNILFDYYYFMKGTPKAFDPIALGEKALENAANPTAQTLTSTAYFITHMIIGESQFYSKALTSETIAAYTPLFKKLETLMSKHFFSYKLDVKLEFLVCSRILGYTSFLEDMIYSEALNSISPYGDFIIDTYNVTAAWLKKDLKTAEHRNILFILSTIPYIHATKPSLKETLL